MNNLVQLRRDPFARMSLVRHRLEQADSCRWCDRLGRFSYGWEGDQNRDRLQLAGPFCSVECYFNYFGMRER